MSIQRYTIVTINGEWQVRGNPDGAWTRTEDALPLEAEVARLTAERDGLANDPRMALTHGDLDYCVRLTERDAYSIYDSAASRWHRLRRAALAALPPKEDDDGA